MSSPLRFAIFMAGYGALLIVLGIAENGSAGDVLLLRTRGFPGACALLGYLTMAGLPLHLAYRALVRAGVFPAFDVAAWEKEFRNAHWIFIPLFVAAPFVFYLFGV